MRELLRIESLMKELLERDLKAKAENLFASYITTRDKVYENVLEEIKRNEPLLTDHGPRHVDNVLENLFKIIGTESKLDGPNLYILCVSSIFHDVGNYYERKGHNKKVDHVFSVIKSGADQYLHMQEQKIVSKIAGAHTGKSKTGSADTISEVMDDHFNGETIYSQELAALLRFADELAEGPQRTSFFSAVVDDYKTSNVYHKHSQVVAIHIDRNREQISLAINIVLRKKSGHLVAQNNVPFNTLMGMIYNRILKLNQERCYCRHYCPKLLSPFKQVRAELSFYFNSGEFNIPISLDIDPIVYNDLVVPGDKEEPLIERYPNYDPDTLRSLILKEVGDE